MHKTLFSISVIEGGIPVKRMKRLVLFMVAAAVLTQATLKAQESAEQELYGNRQMILQLEQDFIDQYGTDQMLINGVGYYNEHNRSSGHKFYGDDRYQGGRLITGGRMYDGVLLKYDIYNQQLLLLTNQGAARDKEIIINGMRLTEFNLGGRSFRKLYFPETDTLFFQVFEGNHVTLLFHWHKILIPVVSGGTSISEFSKPKKNPYILTEDGIRSFSTNKSFISLFPEQRLDLKKFMRSRRIRIRTATERQIRELHQYVNRMFGQNPATS